MGTRGADAPERPSGAAIGRAALLCAVLLALSSSAEGATPAAICRATPSGRAAVAVRIRLDDLFPPELLRLIHLGLGGRILLDVELVRPRPLWFSRRVSRQSLELTVTRAGQGDALVLDGDRPLGDPSRIDLPRIHLDAAGSPEGLEARIQVQLRVITPGSLGKMAAWVAGGGSKEEERSALSAGLLSLLADELAKSVEARCPVARRASVDVR